VLKSIRVTGRDDEELRIDRQQGDIPRPSHPSDLIGGESLVGDSPALLALKAYIRRIAPTTSNVLITGETGTGKECIAKLIHENSLRRRNAFVCINCAAIPDTLLESELFGFEKGAFTGANARYTGRVVLADKGTLFFDEIGDMSLQAQAKILRVLEAKEVLHLGSTRASSVDVRVVAATNCDVDAAAMSSRTFRSDLYYRLNVARLHLPPLRDRRTDIPLLVAHFVRHFAREFASPVEECSKEVMQTLITYDWPGNIRELRNIVEGIFLNGPSDRIEIDDLPPQFRNRLSALHASSLSEGDRLRLALASSRGNKSKAAKALGCSRMTVYRKLSKNRTQDETAALAVKNTPRANAAS
jgi:transcriptional regulator with PAS, ATPase and Fis domain